MRRIASLTFVILATAFSVAGQVNQINTVAGGGAEPTVATSAYLPQAYAAVRDTAGNTYISVPTLSTVFQVSTAGALSAYAGNGIAGFSGDGGAATSAQLDSPEGLAIDGNGNLFIADKQNNRIRRVDATTHNITTVAGSEDPFAGTFAGNGGPATNARLNLPRGVAVDSHGNLFIADNGNGVVREVNATTQNISTYAGGGATAGCPSGPATGAAFANPIGIAVDVNGNVFVSDQSLQIVCKIDASQNIATYAGTLNSAGVPGQPNGDGGVATSAKLLQPNGLTTDGTGNLYIADSGNPKIRKVDTTASHVITTVAGIGLICTNAQEPACGDGAVATSAAFNFPQGVFFDSLGNVVVADTDNQRVRVVSTTGTITALAGGGTGGDGAAGTSGLLGLSQYVAVDSSENVYALESNGERLRELNATTNNLSTVAGDGYGGATIDCTGTTCGAANNGDGGPATQARFVFPDSVATDSSGNFYILDGSTEVVRVINMQKSGITVAGVAIPAGDIATIAGNGQRCGAGGNPNTRPGCGDGGAAKSASLLHPFAVAVDSTGNVYVGDAGLSTVRIVNTAGTISTFAGTPGQSCTTYPTNCGDNGSPTSALLSFPIGLATFNLAGINFVYIADAGDNVIRLVNPETNQITTYAFNGLPTFGGDGGPALNASMEGPSQLAIDKRGNLYVGGGSDNVVRRIEAGSPAGTAGTVITVAGDVDNLDGGFAGDGGPSTSALLENYGLAIFNTASPTDDLFIADSGSNRIRRVNLAPVTVESGAFIPFGPTVAGQVDLFSTQAVFFTNNGLDDLILTVTSSGSGSSAFQLGTSCVPTGTLTCVVTIPPQETSDIEVTFAPPPGSAGTLSATLTVATNDTANPIPSFSLTGTVTASVTLTVTPAASGTVFSEPPGIDCPTTCSTSFAAGSTVTLQAIADPGFAFQGWNVNGASDASKCMSDTTGTCTFTIATSDTIGANFTTFTPPPTNFTITVAGYGNGSGTVTGGVVGGPQINCTITNGIVGMTGCSATFSTATAPSGVLLTSTASAGGSVFVGYLGACSPSTTNSTQCTSLPFTSTVGTVFSGPKVPFAKGQVFLDLGSMIFVLDPMTGKVVQVLNNTLGTGQGMTFDSVGNLYVALQSGYLGVFTNQAAGPTAFGHYPNADNSAYSLVIDPSGNSIVSELFITGDEQPTVLQYSSGAGPTGSPSATYYPAYDTSSVPAFWLELLDTGDTIAYTLGSNTVKVFDLGEQLQHPDIVPNPALTTPTLYALRELPDTSLLVANGNQIVRMSQAGTVLKTYTAGTSALFQNLNLDPDGASFWTNDELSGTVFQINIATGTVMNNGGNGFATNLGFGPTVVTPGIGGIAVFGQPQSGVASPVVIAPTSLTFTSQAPGTTSAPQSVTVSNTGTTAINFAGFTVTGTNAGDFAVPLPTSGTMCNPAGTLAVGASCTINVLFTPTAVGNRTATLNVADNVTGSPQTVALTGTGAGPATVTVAPSSLTFASQPVNSTSPAQSVTVTNAGTGPVTFTSFSITGTNSSSFALASGTNACNPTGTLAASASCTISVTFTPTATGELVATLSIADSATGSPQTVALNGTGNNSPVIISIPPGGSTTGTAKPGGTAFYGLQITGAPGVTGTVQLGCTPSSPTITCAVIPSSIVLTGKPIEVAFGIQTFCQGATGTGSVPAAPRSGPAGGIGLLLLSLALGGMAWAMQRNRRVALTFATLMLVALGTAACGGLAKGPNGATPPGTYTLTLTTTFNGQTQTLPNFLTLVVK
jgi:sugar lactone lactonase YvrE